MLDIVIQWIRKDGSDDTFTLFSFNNFSPGIQSWFIIQERKPVFGMGVNDCQFFLAASTNIPIHLVVVVL